MNRVFEPTSIGIQQLGLKEFSVKPPLYPINVWAYQANAWRLFNFCESLHEALDCAKKLPYTPVVLSTKRDLPFHEQLLSENEFGELTREERFGSVLQ
jgi:hypothetical protein